MESQGETSKLVCKGSSAGRRDQVEKSVAQGVQMQGFGDNYEKTPGFQEPLKRPCFFSMDSRKSRRQKLSAHQMCGKQISEILCLHSDCNKDSVKQNSQEHRFRLIFPHEVPKTRWERLYLG